MKLIPFVILTAIVVMAFGNTSNKALAGTGLTIQPIKVSETLKPRQSVSGFIKLSNASEESINVEISTEDFIPTAGTPNISFISRAPGNTTVKDWITINAPPTFIFEKDGVKEIPYTITAPLNAEPGSHFGVIFFKATRIDDSGQLKIGTRVGVLMFVTIPGNQLQRGQILDFSAPAFVDGRSVPFTIGFENTGTVHFEPKGNIKIKNIFGKEVGDVEVNGQTVLPTGRRDLNVSWDSGRLLVGRYTATITLFDGEGNELSAKGASFYAFPTKYGMYFVGIVLLLFWTLKFIRKRVNISVTLSK